MAFRRYTLDSELRRMAKGCKDERDRHTLERAAKVLKDYTREQIKTADVLELEQLYRLEDLR